MKRVLFFFGVASLFASCLSSPPGNDQTAQFQQDTTAIRSYLVQNAIPAIKLSRGIWFVVDSASSGIRPVFADSMVVTYQMKLLSNNSVIDQSTTPTTLVLSNLLYGIQIAMPQFQKGNRGRIFIPSFYGYQNSQTNGVPPNSVLIFQFKLLDVKDQQLRKDTTTIGAYLASQGIKPTIDPSGLRYTVDTLHVGPSPILSDSVQIKYTTKELGAGAVIEQSTAKFLLTDLVVALQAGLPKIQQGSWVTFYAPSGLVYGPIGNSQIAVGGKVNMVFNVQLMKVIRH
jgi:FKBP-type peptidyl-prolyl cis-trans isomerase FkpA